MAQAAAFDLAPVDIAPWREGGTGIDYAHSFDSGLPGPHVLVNALAHGNDICGAAALDRMLRAGIRPRRGRLSLVFANVAAYRRFDLAEPGSGRFVDEDFNRLWSPAALEGKRRSSELDRARALRPLIDTVDFLLDIHSMQADAPALMLCGALDKGRRMALAVGTPALIVADSGHVAGTRLRDYADFGDPRSAKNALLVECGQHWRGASADIAHEVATRFLVHCGTIETPLAPIRETQRLAEVTDTVTVHGERFAFAADYRGLHVVPRAGTVIGHDGPTPVRTPYDDCLLIMPSRTAGRGQTAVRLARYVT